MKTSFKRFAALALAAIMVLGTMNLSAWADETAVGNRTADSELKIGGLAEGDIVRFYKVLEENEDTADMTGWVYTSPFAAMSSTYGAPVSKVTGNPAQSKAMALTAAIAGDIARLTVATTPAQTVEVGSDCIAKWAAGVPSEATAPEPGMYVAIITAKDVNTVYNPVFVSVDFVPFATQNPSTSQWTVDESATYSDSGAAKKTTLTINKSSDTTEDAWDDEKIGTSAEQANSMYTTAIGDSVSFFVDTTIPGYGTVYESPKFEITDKLTNLTLNYDSITVYDTTGGGKTEIPSSKYTKEGNTETTEGYKITFDPEYLKTIKAPMPIRVEYSAIVSTDALENVNVENNTVQIVYNTNPSDSSEFAVKKDETNHYTFTLDANSLFEGTEIEGSKGSELVKIGLDAAGNPITSTKVTSEITKSNSVSGPLQGAKFKLYTDSQCRDEDEYIPKSADGTSSGSGLVIESGADGRFTIQGLDAGVYYLKETEAPAGFIKYQDPIKIEIETTIVPKTIEQWFFNDGWYNTQAEANAIATSAGYGVEGAKALNEVVKYYTYDTDVLQSYRVIVGGKTIDENGTRTAEYTFYNSATSAQIHISETKPIELPFSIPNTQGVELPSTGGVGTTIFYMGGAVLILLAGVLLVSKRRIA